MINEDQQLRRAVFLPLYYTVISLMVSCCHIMIIIGYHAMDQVPLSLWAAWGIYSEPIRYRSLFPHNEARKQAIAGLSQCPSLRHCLSAFD